MYFVHTTFNMHGSFEASDANSQPCHVFVYSVNSRARWIDTSFSMRSAAASRLCRIGKSQRCIESQSVSNGILDRQEMKPPTDLDGILSIVKARHCQQRHIVSWLSSSCLACHVHGSQPFSGNHPGEIAVIHRCSSRPASRAQLRKPNTSAFRADALLGVPRACRHGA